MEVSYDEHLKKTSNNKKITLKFEKERKETEELFNKRVDKLIAEATRSIYMKYSALDSNAYSSFITNLQLI